MHLQVWNFFPPPPPVFSSIGGPFFNPRVDWPRTPLREDPPITVRIVPGFLFVRCRSEKLGSPAFDILPALSGPGPPKTPQWPWPSPNSQVFPSVSSYFLRARLLKIPGPAFVSKFLFAVFPPRNFPLAPPPTRRRTVAQLIFAR